ncbi:unnamed protein product [Auanema sp. JU1783]|nr:unnamed protein product [Auanema sp. JU1783]
MVRVLANGDVVNDDDVRAQSSRDQRASSRNSQQPSADNNAQGSIDGLSQYWAAANQQLRSFGLNSYQVAGYTIEPAHMVLALISLIFMGPLGIILVLILVAATQERVTNVPTATATANTTRNPFSEPPSAYGGPSANTSSQPKKGDKVFGGLGQRLGS